MINLDPLIAQVTAHGRLFGDFGRRPRIAKMLAVVLGVRAGLAQIPDQPRFIDDELGFAGVLVLFTGEICKILMSGGFVQNAFVSIVGMPV